MGKTGKRHDMTASGRRNSEKDHQKPEKTRNNGVLHRYKDT